MGTRTLRAALALLSLAATLLLPVPALAGRSCEAPHRDANSVARGLQLALRTHEALEAAWRRDGTQVVLLARAGQDLRRYGLRYSHLGIAYRTHTAQGQPAWRVLHKLNACGTAVAAIYRQGLAQFFLDTPWRYEAAWVAPRPDAQARLMALLADTSAAVRLQHRPYSMVSYAWGLRYQQSNQWAIETFAYAQDPQASSRVRAQAWLRLHGYRPTTLHLGLFARLGARLTQANVAFDDHPDAMRFSDRIETVTVESVFDWMRQSGLGGAPVRVE